MITTQLRVELAKRGLTAERAARELGIHRSEFSRIANRLRVPTQRAAKALEAYFGQPLDALLKPITKENEN